MSDLTTKQLMNQIIGPFQEEVTEKMLKAFCSAVGAEYTGEAPPTYMTRYRQGEFELLQKNGVPLTSILHGEQEYEYFAPIKPGMKVEYETKITKSHEKKGSSGSMHFLVFETSVKESGKALGLAKTTIVVRGGLKK